MALTGAVLPFLVWGAAIAMFVLIVVRPRAIGPGWLRALRRAGYQLVVTVTVLLAVGVTLNDQYSWYANWSDLASTVSGTDPGRVVAAGAAAVDAAAATGDLVGTEHQKIPVAKLPGLRSLGLDAGPGPATGQIRDYTVTGPISGISSKITVWFPPQYTDPAMAQHRFPVLEGFHGAPGSPRQLWFNMSLGKRMAQQTAAGNIAPSVIVMPNWTPGNVDTECVDGGPGQPQLEQWLTRDVTTWVEQHLRVGNDRGSWATFGLSAGAWCANMLAMLHPMLYSAAISLGGYYLPDFSPRYVPFNTGSPQQQHYNLLALAHNRPPKVALWVETSKVDSVSYATTQELIAAARPPMSVTADVLPNAGHRISVWLPLINQTLQWLGKTSPGFKPAPASGLSHPLSPTPTHLQPAH